MQDQDALLQIVAFLAFFFLILIVFAVVIGIGLVRHFRRRSTERELYPKLAADLGWSYSPGVFPGVKGAVDYVDGRMFPNTRMIGTPAAHFISGNSGNASFAVFNYSYNLSARFSSGPGMSGPAAPRMMHETCVVMITSSLALPELAIDQKNEIARAFNSVMGDPGNAFNDRYKANGSNAFLSQKLTPQFQAMVINSGVIRILGNGNLLAVFFNRNENEKPDLIRTRSHLDSAWKLAEMLKP